MSVVIKTRSGTGAPSSLETGELGVDTTVGKLYVGSASGSVLTINPTQIAAGTLDSQSMYWDNTTGQWTANSNILLTSSGTLTATGGIINSAIGAIGPSTGAFTNLTTTGTLTVGTTLSATGGITGSTIGASSPATGAFTALVATSIGVASQGSGKFTTLEASGNIKSTAGTGQFYGSGSRDTNTVIGSATSPSGWTTAAENMVLIGKDAGVATTSGTGNVLIGTSAGRLLETGSGNTCIGVLAGYNLPAASNGNVLIGAGTWSFSNAVNDTVVISAGALGVGSGAVERLKVDNSGGYINGDKVRAGKFGYVPTIYDPFSSLPTSPSSGQVDGELVIARNSNTLYIAVWNAGDNDWKYIELLP